MTAAPHRDTRVEYASDHARRLLEANGLNGMDDVFACGEPLLGQPEYRGDMHANRSVTR
ncbi:MAG: hypothetical protein GWO02_15190, partial [Gammaproteobacteria bacterium]|nr:hypothetical protein [Gammaproteobacteria bacterium]